MIYIMEFDSVTFRGIAIHRLNSFEELDTVRLDKESIIKEIESNLGEELLETGLLSQYVYEEGEIRREPLPIGD